MYDMSQEPNRAYLYNEFKLVYRRWVLSNVRPNMSMTGSRHKKRRY